jgi:hypothetical protein
MLEANDDEVRVNASLRLMLETVVKRWKENLNDG